MKEQKLFFTRNGRYTFWEMLSHLNEKDLKELYSSVLSKEVDRGCTHHFGGISPFLYIEYMKDLSPSDEGDLLLEVEERFKKVEKPQM